MTTRIGKITWKTLDAAVAHVYRTRQLSDHTDRPSFTVQSMCEALVNLGAADPEIVRRWHPDRANVLRALKKCWRLPERKPPVKAVEEKPYPRYAVPLKHPKTT